MGHHLAFPHGLRNDVLAEVVRGALQGDVLVQHPVQVVGREDVDPHGGQRTVRLARHGGRISRLFHEGGDLLVLVDGHHAEGLRFLAIDLNAAHRHAGAREGVRA